MAAEIVVPHLVQAYLRNKEVKKKCTSLLLSDIRGSSLSAEELKCALSGRGSDFVDFPLPQLLPTSEL